MKERRPEDNINQAVGQPRIDKPLGGRSLPGIQTPEKPNHTVRNVALAVGGTAIAVGGAYVAINSGNSTEPQPTKAPGAIVEPSKVPDETPRATISGPTEAPTVNITPKPVEVTAVPTAEPTPELKTLNQIISEAPKDPVKLGTFVDSANKAIEADNKYILTQYPGIQSLIDDCKDPNLSSANQVPACRVATLDFLKQAQATGKQEYYIAGSNGLYYIKVKFPNRYSEIVTEFQTILK